jgi:hypothetical protein
MSDAPAHHLLVLLPPLKVDSQLPEPLVVLQVAFEANITKQAILEGLRRGIRAGGDMIPWPITQQALGIPYIVQLYTEIWQGKWQELRPCPIFVIYSILFKSNFILPTLCRLPDMARKVAKAMT